VKYISENKNKAPVAARDRCVILYVLKNTTLVFDSLQRVKWTSLRRWIIPQIIFRTTKIGKL